MHQFFVLAYCVIYIYNYLLLTYLWFIYCLKNKYQCLFSSCFSAFIFFIFFALIVKYSVLKYEVLDAVPDANKEFDCSVPPIIIDPSQFHGSLHKAKDETDSNCWTSPGGKGFMIRGKTYLKDNTKVVFASLLNHWPLFVVPIYSVPYLLICEEGFYHFHCYVNA